MAKIKIEEEKKPEITSETGTETQSSVTEPIHVSDLFSRQINNRNGIKSVTLRRVLTRPLVAMANVKQLLFECKSEMYVMTLPMKGRAGGAGGVRVIDGTDLAVGEEVTLMCNEMMVAAFKRADYRVVTVTQNAEGEDVIIEVPGASIIGKAFAFKRGDMKEGKGYRVVDTVEVDVQR